MFITILGFIAFWLVVSLYIYSAGEIVRDDNTPFFAFYWDNKNGSCLILYLFGLFWNVELSIAFC